MNFASLTNLYSNFYARVCRIASILYINHVFTAFSSRDYINSHRSKDIVLNERPHKKKIGQKRTDSQETKRNCRLLSGWPFKWAISGAFRTYYKCVSTIIPKSCIYINGVISTLNDQKVLSKCKTKQIIEIRKKSYAIHECNK